MKATSFFPSIHPLRKTKATTTVTTILHPPSSGQLTASHKIKISCIQIVPTPWNSFSGTRVSVFVPPGAKQSSRSLLDCFFQINIFPKDLNPKQQPRLKSNTTQKFRSSVLRLLQFLQVLGMVQSMTVYSIAKCLFSHFVYIGLLVHINILKAWKHLQCSF